MGVKDLWNIISPSGDRKPLFELQGKTIAIDLSCWIVDSQSVVDHSTQPKMYLRNLYFRTVHLLLQETFPVFVLEGKAPDLKHKEMDRRNKLRTGADERVKKSNRKGGRNRLNVILKECEKMLMLMGLKCIRSHGEAEAMCAYLNQDGLVDGCISQDSDCFLYGAKTVYRNVCTSVQGNRGGTGGSVDEYTMEKIQRLFKLDRNKMIAMALLCGCDYDDGVNGVGKEAVMKLFKFLEGENVLDRLKSWSTHPKFKRMEEQLNDPNICISCGHRGKIRVHLKSGCEDCGTVSRCNDSYKDLRPMMKHEINLREKALAVEGFPNQALIDEFLVRKGPMPSSLDLQWRQPQIVEFVSFMCHHVCWEPEYAFAKIFSLATRWQLRHFADIPRENRILMHGVMIPEKIKKIRKIRCVESYEIIWLDKDCVLEGLMLGKMTDDEDDDDDVNDKVRNELVSIEPQEAVRKCYPELVEEFEKARQAKTKKPAKTRERKKKTVVAEKENEPPDTIGKGKKPAVKRSRKKAVDAGNKKIDEFIKTAAVNPPSLEDSFEALSLAPKRTKPTDFSEFGKPTASGTPKRGPQFDRLLATAKSSSVLDGTLGRMFDELTPDDFASEMEDSSMMCEAIERICSKQTTPPDGKNCLLSGLSDENQCKAAILEIEDENLLMSEAMERICSKRTTPPDVKNCLSLRLSDENQRKNAIPSNPTKQKLFEKYREPAIVAIQESSDEFDEFDTTYVPISQRVTVASRVADRRKN